MYVSVCVYVCVYMVYVCGLLVSLLEKKKVSSTNLHTLYKGSGGDRGIIFVKR